ncbi:MAG: Type II phosphatidic acid phosphatase [Idiomarina sp. T82-3]|uniref:phosphatase PAP2 family protein n=1 Tax=Idiomarina TaxID=135575 RepID=UPI0007975040|nr:phosphatase PAP2 family protein [Idiomarina sp. T82-3]KXS35420.1 MAG: Type II phosphatidic acid phosphatase [Idiomarina sp. T82-3]
MVWLTALQETALRVDLSWFTRIHRLNQHRWIAAVAQCFSRSGDGYWYFIVGLVFVLHSADGQAFFTACAAIFLFERPLYWWLKNKFKRARPTTLMASKKLFVAQDEFSFPSGHTCTAFIFVTCLSYYYPVFALYLLPWACAVGVSRVVVGAHYVSDVCVGALLGIAFVETFFLIYFAL